MRVGYLHIGPPAHGVTRYGRILAEAARDYLGGEVIEDAIELPGAWPGDERMLRETARRLARADVVHVQYNERVWGGPEEAPRNVWAFLHECPAPIVVTLHDVRMGYGPWSIGRRLWGQRRAANERPAPAKPDATGVPGSAGLGASWAASARKAWQFVRREYGNARATRLMVEHAARVLVCTAEEARRARSLVGADALERIPHFVEKQDLQVSKEDAKRRLGLEGRRVVTVLGYIHRKKGHDLVIEALPMLPDDVYVVCAGQPGKNSPAYASSLEYTAQDLGVADRMRITGYVPDDDLDAYLAATDLAVCPFRSASASGSLSTWIAVETPVLASDLPIMREYNDLAPGALAIFSPHTPDALAEAARTQLRTDQSSQIEALRSLKARLAPGPIIREHAAVYRAVAQRSEAEQA